jgi:hypothetical protein
VHLGFSSEERLIERGGLGESGYLSTRSVTPSAENTKW